MQKHKSHLEHMTTTHRAFCSSSLMNLCRPPTTHHILTYPRLSSCLAPCCFPPLICTSCLAPSPLLCPNCLAPSLLLCSSGLAPSPLLTIYAHIPYPCTNTQRDWGQPHIATVDKRSKKTFSQFDSNGKWELHI